MGVGRSEGGRGRDKQMKVAMSSSRRRQRRNDGRYNRASDTDFKISSVGRCDVADHGD